MNETLQNQVVDRLKRESCHQQHCLSNNQDNIELIVFDNPEAKRTGLMCSACLIDSELIGQLLPVQKFILPIRKYMALIVSFYKQYLVSKEDALWGPTVVTKVSQAVHRKTQLFYNQGLKAALELGQFAETIARKSAENMKKVYQDLDFQKIVQFLNEQNEVEQERMMIGKELTRICSKIQMIEGKVKYATEDAVKKQAQEIVLNYRGQVGLVSDALKELVEVHRDCLKRVIG